MKTFRSFPVSLWLFGWVACGGCTKIFESDEGGKSRFTSPGNPSSPDTSGTKPSCSISTPQQGWVNTPSFRLDFSCLPPSDFPDDSIDRVQCRDSQNASWADCASLGHHVFSPLADGLVVLEIRAQTISDRKSPIRKFNLQVDSTPPEVQNFNFEGFVDNTPQFGLDPFDPSPGSGIADLLCQLIGPGHGAQWWDCGEDSTRFILLSQVLTNGQSYTLNVKAKDLAQNTSPAVSSSFVVQYSAPSELCSISPITSPTRFTSQSVQFSCQSQRPISIIECKLDSGTWETCQSPKSYSGLSEGSHTFLVRFKNAEGIASAVQQQDWLVDTTPPMVQITRADPDGLSAHFEYIATDNDIVSDTACSVRLSSSSPQYVPCSSTYFVEGLLMGRVYSFWVRATDRAGNVATRYYTWDTQAPDGLPTCLITSTFPNSYSTSASSAIGFYCSSPHSDVNYPECRVHGGSWAPCSTQSTHNVSGLVDGQNAQLCVRSSDKWNRLSESACLNWNVSLVAPQIEHLSVDIAHPHAWLQFAANSPSCPIVGFECKMDGAQNQHGWRSCSNPVVYTQLLLNSDYVFQVRAQSLCHQTSPSRSIQWRSRADYVGPRCSFQSSAQTAGWSHQAVSAPIVCEGSPPNVSYLCSDNGTDWSACTSPVSIQSTQSGVVRKYVRGKDDLNILGPVSYQDWRFDHEDPTVSVSTLRWVQDQPEFVFEALDPSSGVERTECSIDGVKAWSACSSPTRYNAPELAAAGRTFVFRVRAFDNIGRSSNEAVHTWTNGAWGPWGACVRQPDNSGLQVRACSSPAVVGWGLGCAGYDQQACAPPPAPVCTNFAVNAPACNLCGAGRVYQNGQCVLPTWSVAAAAPAGSVYSQRRYCSHGTLCGNLPGWVHFIYNQKKYAHRCVDGGRGFWSILNGHQVYSCKSPVGYVDSGHHCSTEHAVVAPSARGSNGGVVRYNQLRNQGAPLPAWPPGGGANYANDEQTRRVSCWMNGFQRVVSYKGSSWKSPGNNSVVRWNNSTNRFGIYNGNTFNNWLSDISCGARLHSSCVDEWQWIFRK